MMGADGVTQVARVQTELGLDGTGVYVGVVDDGVDYLSTANFGACTAINTPPDTCRVKAGYNSVSPDLEPLPQNFGFSQPSNHGTAVAGCAVGAFPQKLFDADGNEIPWQRGPAYNANIGVYGQFWNPSTFERAIADRMDVFVGSFGWRVCCPPPGSVPGWSQWETGCERSAIDRATGNRCLSGHMTRVPVDTETIVVVSAGNAGIAGLFAQNLPAPHPAAITVANLITQSRVGARIALRAQVPNGVQTANIDAVLRQDAPQSFTSLNNNLPAIVRPIDCFNANFQTDAYYQGLLNEFQNNNNRVAFFFNCNPLEAGWVPDGPPSGTIDSFRALAYSARLVLVTVRSAANDTSMIGDASNTNLKGPVLQLSWADAGRLAGSYNNNPLSLTIEVTGVSGRLSDSPRANQPDPSTSWGPGLDLGIKPTLAAPGGLYTSVNNGGYQTMIGTSFSAPYVAGCVALWKQARLAENWAPAQGDTWRAAARREFMLTAQPIPYARNKMWPAAKVGAGMIQVLAAIQNRVTITPHEILLRSPRAGTTQSVTLTLRSGYNCMVSYRLRHSPAATVLISNTWLTGDAAAIFRDVEMEPTPGNNPYPTVTVRSKIGPQPVSGDFNNQFVNLIGSPDASGFSQTVTVRFVLPADMLRQPFIYSGYLQFIPVPSGQNTFQDCPPESLFPLSVVYQGASMRFHNATEVRTSRSLSGVSAIDTRNNNQVVDMGQANYRVCVLPEGDGPPNYYYKYHDMNLNAVRMARPTCTSGVNYPGVLFVSTTALEQSRVCLVVAAIRPLDDRILVIERCSVVSADSRTCQGAWVREGKASLGASVGSANRGPYLPCNLYNGVYNNTQNQLTTLQQTFANRNPDFMYRFSLRLQPPIAVGDRPPLGTITQAVYSEVLLDEFIRITN